MNLKQAFKIAAKSIIAKKGRSLLTMLGVIIGLAAVIALVSFAQGQNQWMKDYFAQMGDNIVQVSAWTWNGQDISEKLYAYCQSLDEYLIGITPANEVYGELNVKYGAKNINTYNASWDERPQVTLGNQQFTVCKNYTLDHGRDLTYIDIKNRNQVCVLGSKMAKTLFDYADPVGESITINGTPFRVVGVYAEGDPNNNTGKDRILLLPYTLERLFSNVDKGNFVAKARDAASVPKAIGMLNVYLPGLVGNSGYANASSPNSWQNSAEEENKMQSLFLGGIAAISLLVGGIGIMNIMLVTVTERTREIGIRKAIGAERKSIIVQFLIEACLICGVGGVLGIAIGYLATAILCQLVLNFIVWPSIQVTLGAFAFSVVMGVVFGLYPAVKASGLQPVEALRAD